MTPECVMILITEAYGDDIDTDARLRMISAFTRSHPVLVQHRTEIKDLPAELKRSSYKYPRFTDQPFAINSIIKHNDDLEAFELMYSDKLPVTSPTLLDIACFYGATKIAEFLMTTHLVSSSHPLYWLALGKQHTLAKSLVLSKAAKLDKNWLASTPTYAPSIIDIITHHNDKSFIKSCVEVGVPVREMDKKSKLVTSSEAMKENGSKFFSNGQYAKAIDCYTKAINILPTQALYSNRSISYYKLGKLHESLQDAQTSIKLDATWIKGYLRQAIALKDLRRFQESKVACKKGLLIAPDNRELSECLGSLSISK
eukprot:gene18256-21847_t